MLFHERPEDLLDSKVKLKLLVHLFGQPEAEMSERELARVLGVSNFSVNRLMRFFEERNLVERRRLGQMTIWRLRSGSYYHQLLRQILGQLLSFPDPIEHLKKIVLESYPIEQVSMVYLYGSVAGGRESYNSDIDLFVVTKRGAKKEKVEQANDKLRSSCPPLYGNPVQIVTMSEAEFSRRENSALIKQVKNGIRIIPA
ncbi:MAG: nucleotidyltransferase domain-containing protein [Methanobacteriota archaeon]